VPDQSGKHDPNRVGRVRATRPIKASSKRYGYAAEHLATCAELAGRIEDFGELETQDAYLARLKTQHGRKYGFWSLTEA
jgi:hypothetical protein